MERLATILKERTTRLRERVGFFRVHGPDAMAESRYTIFIIFGIGLALGVFAKGFTREHIAIGYWDYLLPDPQTVVSLNTLQKSFLENGGSLAFSPREEPTAPSCSKSAR